MSHRKFEIGSLAYFSFRDEPIGVKVDGTVAKLVTAIPGNGGEWVRTNKIVKIETGSIVMIVSKVSDASSSHQTYVCLHEETFFYIWEEYLYDEFSFSEIQARGAFEV